MHKRAFVLIEGDILHFLRLLRALNGISRFPSLSSKNLNLSLSPFDSLTPSSHFSYFSAIKTRCFSILGVILILLASRLLPMVLYFG